MEIDWPIIQISVEFSQTNAFNSKDNLKILTNEILDEIGNFSIISLL